MLYYIVFFRTTKFFFRSVVSSFASLSAFLFRSRIPQVPFIATLEHFYFLIEKNFMSYFVNVVGKRQRRCGLKKRLLRHFMVSFLKLVRIFIIFGTAILRFSDTTGSGKNILQIFSHNARCCDIAK